MNNFWTKLQKPIIVLAPMADVTDIAFRQIIIKHSRYGGRDIGDGSKENLPADLPAKASVSAGAFRVGGPDVLWTEFVSADGLCHPKGRKKLIRDLAFNEAERPIVAQLFSAHPEKMEEASRLVQELGFDGVDINMGCPDRTVEKQGAGASLIKDSKLARELIRSAKAGAPNLPVSVKTRIGYNKNELETWLPELLAENPAVVTIHARTRKEMSDVPARWEHVREAVAIRDRLKSDTLIFGNGDVLSVEDAREKAKEFGADGVMLGRAIFGNPFLFAPSPRLNLGSGERFSLAIPIRQKLEALVEHTKLFEKLMTGQKNFAVMKKHYKAYVKGFASPGGHERHRDGAKELRTKLMDAKDASEVENLVKEFLKTL